MSAKLPVVVTCVNGGVSTDEEERRNDRLWSPGRNITLVVGLMEESHSARRCCYGFCFLEQDFVAPPGLFGATHPGARSPADDISH